MKEYPESVENDWNRLYAEFPEKYHLFAKAPIIKGRTFKDILYELYPWNDKIIVDIGSGTGLSTFPFAKDATLVYGIEPEPAMREEATKNKMRSHFTNIEFLEGSSSSIPLGEDAADLVLAITTASLHGEKNITEFIREAERVTKVGGCIFTLNIAPNSYGGELATIINEREQEWEKRESKIRHDTFTKYGYSFIDYWNIKDYESVENITKSYGFIFGKNTIEYLIKHQKSTIKWYWRVHYKLLES